MNKQEHAFSRGLFYILACLLLAACGSGGDDIVPLQGVSSYQLSTTAPTSAISPAGSAAISISLRDSAGNPAANQTIQLSKTGPATLSSGSVTTGTGNSSISVVTDTAGTASVILSGASAAVGSSGSVEAKYTDSKGSIAKSAVSYSIQESENVILTLGKNTVNSGTGDSVSLSGIIIDSTGQVVTGKSITFTVAGGYTNGTILASSNTSANYLPSTTDLSNKTITINAGVSGSTATASATINVVGTSVQISSPTTSTTLGNTITLQGSLKDGNGSGIGNTSVLLSSPNLPGGSQTITTLSNGNFPAGITATISSATGGVATFTATALGATGTLSINVSGTSFTITSPSANAEIPVNTSTPVILTYLNNGTPVVGSQVFFSSSLGTVSSATANTNASGQASINVSSSSAGQAIISANTSGGALLASQTVLFVSSTPATISVQAGQTGLVSGAQTPITATVLDAANNPVKGKVVEFSVITDPSNGPGLSASTATTDASGKASVSY
ncbi:MAG: Ig-like domain-containing protein, partial [Pedobacter sp.]|nr:Ig-like domain-containing protein [Pedobacter sp.]